MTCHVCACHVAEPGAAFTPAVIERRALGPHDLLIDIAYCGICHSDIHYAHDEFGRTRFPLVPGHEIAGVVSGVGGLVSRFKAGDRVGIGVMIDSCRECSACKQGLEQYCAGARVMTYNGVGRDGQPTYGGYSEKIVADENYVLRIPDTMSLAGAAPLMCAGVTMYSPLRHWQAGPGKRVAILGLGGLGHVGVMIAKAMGAQVTVIEVAEAKREAAMRCGADDFALASDVGRLAGQIDLIVSTVPASFPLDPVLAMLALDGVLVNTSIPEAPLSVAATSLLDNRRSIAGTRSGGIGEIQEMLDFCAEHGIEAQVETIGADRIDEAYARVIAGDVQFRFVIDVATIKAANAAAGVAPAQLPPQA